MSDAPISFVEEIATEHAINTDCIICQYLERKTKAADRSSKARRSLGNLYALYVLATDYAEGNHEGSTFTELMDRMKEMPFGSKLQNHPLDNRLNDEMRRQYGLADHLLPVQPANLGTNKKSRKISEDLLASHGNDPTGVAIFIVQVVSRYIQIISDNQTAFMEEIEAAEDEESILKLVESAFAYESDARLFEIISYAILYLHFLEIQVRIEIEGEIHDEHLLLYRTGRTNANDGGIDFVLKPLGKFFQVTETLDFRKYFLDFDKTNRFPISFVIKTEKQPEDVLETIEKDAAKAMDTEVVQRYMDLFENVYSLPILREYLDTIKESPAKVTALKEQIISSFKLEYGLLD